MRQNKTIGSILLDVELVTQEDIEQALEIQKQRGKRLGEVLVQLGVVSDDDIRWALAEQLNLPYVNIRKDQVDVDVATLLPEKLARRYHVIPILKIDNELTVVVDDPLNTTIIDDIERITKSDVKISLGRTSDILLAIDEIYGSSEERISSEEEAPPKFISPWFQEEEIQKILNDPSGQVLMEQTLSQALEHGVSRIYFQPGFECCHISYRINGVLQEQLQLNEEWYAILLFRLKIYAGFEMATLRHPQYREFSYQELPASQETPPKPATTLAVSITPTASGEAAVLHAIHKPVDRLWEQLRHDAVSELQEQELTEVRALQDEINYRKSGAILLGGSPYFDKMTTLYALSGNLDPIRKKIVALEHFSEYRARDYYQIKYSDNENRADASLDVAEPTQQGGSLHASQFRAQRQSVSEAGIQPPAQGQLSAWLDVVGTHHTDALLVDHIESDIVLSQCLDFAAHGLLFASLGFPNVFRMLMYLRDCRVKASVLNSRVQALVAQQSVRKLCRNCRQPDHTEQAGLLLQELLSEQNDKDSDSVELFKAQGCSKCHMSGYTESLALFEILRMENWLQELLLRGASLKDIQAEAEEHAFQSLKKKATALLLSGQTSLEEVFSIVKQ